MLEVTKIALAPLRREFSTLVDTRVTSWSGPFFASFSRIDGSPMPAFQDEACPIRSGQASRRSMTYGRPKIFAANHVTPAVGKAGTVPITRSGSICFLFLMSVRTCERAIRSWLAAFDVIESPTRYAELRKIVSPSAPSYGILRVSLLSPAMSTE